MLTLILLMYLILGCFMDSLSMILLTVPVIFPIVTALDFGLPPEEFALWFGILILIVVEVGLITPAGRDESLRHQRHGQGHAAEPDLSRRPAVRDLRHRADDHPRRSSR